MPSQSVPTRYPVIVIGGGHAGLEAAWSAANLLAHPHSVALVTLDPAKIGVMSCNPAIGGLAKGQLVREIDAMGGIMGMAADTTGIQFKMLNPSRGPAVHGPRCQSDKHAYARETQRLLAEREEIDIIAGSVEEILTESGAVTGMRIALRGNDARDDPAGEVVIHAQAVVLTTGTFLRGLMHVGDRRTRGGRVGEGSAEGISGWLARAGFELGRLKTGTPPRLLRETIDWDALPLAGGDAQPEPFSELTSLDRFPRLPQVDCRQTNTTEAIHRLIQANLHRAPMYSGAIDATGPRYCPSIEDKIVRFPDRHSHNVFLEPESLDDSVVYCNGISTSLPAEVQEAIVHAMPGCENAKIVQYGYAVEYDMVRPHQIYATCETRLVAGLFLAGQINGTSGYEEAAAQGLVAGINAAHRVLERGEWVPGRDEAYIGVLMDDLVTKTPTEPYRMFTSRAEYRLLLRADNASDRLTPIAAQLGLLDSTAPGRARLERFAIRQKLLELGSERMNRKCDISGETPAKLVAQDRLDVAGVESLLESDEAMDGLACNDRALLRAAAKTLYAQALYAGYIRRQQSQIKQHAAMERKRIPRGLGGAALAQMRREAREAIERYQPVTMGQASRLEGVTPADLTLLAVLVERHRRRES